jgi:osmotically-inducible protein OsmY
MPATFADILKFRLGAIVIASDGEAGSLDSIAVAPGQRTVTAAGVKIGRGPGGVTKAVPLERITDATVESVTIALTREALLQTMPNVEKSMTTLSRSTQVTRGGKGAGSLTHVSADRASHALTHLIVRRLGGEALIDPLWINGISDDGRSIEIVPPAGVALPEYRPDAELSDEINRRLFDYPRLRVDLRAVSVRVADGEVWLRGNVSTSLNRRVISDLLVGTRGLVAVHNELVADNELAVAIKEALDHDPRTHGQHIGVYANLGQVFLRGQTTAPGVVEAAVQIAKGVPGQVQVVNELAVGSASFIPMLAPVTGDEDIIPGGD